CAPQETRGMITPDYARTLAAYNRWMNGTVYAAAARLSDAERKRDLGAFFKSLHGTLNHILVGDRMWMGRLTGQPVSFPSLAHELCAGFDELRRERAVTDDAIDAFVETLTPERNAGPLRYRTAINPRNAAFPFGFVLTHFFNHQTHHRGQATTLLMQLGVDPGLTDLLYLPGFERPG
ncbi:MAG: DinB family protein, partial [Alphaproteobacteria bacterium]